MVKTCRHGQNLSTWSKLVNMVKTCQHGQNLSSWSKMVIMVKNGHHGQKWSSWSKMVIMVKNGHNGQKWSSWSSCHSHQNVIVPKCLVPKCGYGKILECGMKNHSCWEFSIFPFWHPPLFSVVYILALIPYPAAGCGT